MPSHLVDVYSTRLGEYTFEEGYTPQDNAHAAFLIPNRDDNEGYLELDYVAFLENVWPCFLKAEAYVFKLTNAPAVVNGYFLLTWFLLYCLCVFHNTILCFLQCAQTSHLQPS